MFFSIIIPVYNAEKTLERCLCSLRQQSFTDYEVLLIDDGSQDGSYEICKGFAEEDARFNVIRQDNRGPSAARNEGLKRAKGTYLCFVDSDDYVVPEYLSRLSQAIEKSKAEVLFFGYYSVDQNGTELGTHLPPTGIDGFALLEALSEENLFGYTWIKCFLRELVGDYRFPEAITLHEDEIFTCRVLEKTDNVAVVPEAVYCYVSGGPNMLTGRTYENYCVLSDRVFSAWEQLLSKAPENEAFLQRKANAYVERCRFYGFERDVNVRTYFASLAAARFFRLHTQWTSLDHAIDNRKWFSVWVTRLIYKMKNRAAQLCGRN